MIQRSNRIPDLGRRKFRVIKTFLGSGRWELTISSVQTGDLMSVWRRGVRRCGWLVLVLLMALPGVARADCADADLISSADNIDRVGSAIVCLHNEQRT